MNKNDFTHLLDLLSGPHIKMGGLAKRLFMNWVKRAKKVIMEKCFYHCNISLVFMYYHRQAKLAREHKDHREKAKGEDEFHAFLCVLCVL